MKKLFTLLALLTCFLGANAKEIVDAEVDFSKYSDISEWNFPYGWGGSESARARLSIVDGCLHFESTEATDPTWDCQFFPIGFGSNAEPDITYTVHFKIKGSVAQNISLLGFGTTPYGQFPVTTDWVEGTVDYVATSTDGNLLMQCGDYVGSFDIAYLQITHDGKEERPVEWVELLTNGNAETPWTDEQKNVAYNDMENNFTICAWSKEKGRNLDDNGAWNPFPAGIENVDGSNVFVVHGQIADTEGDASAWDNQFWIQAPRQIKEGEQVKVHFRYKASEAATTNTQIHHQTPSDYMHYQAIGDVKFTTEWQEFDQVVTWPSGGDNKGWSIAFNLNPQNKNAIDFYFDDLSIQEMKLDHGFFVAASNTNTGIEYDFDNAIPFEDNGDSFFQATVGTAGKQDSWVNEIMISTVRGNDRAFKSSTIKPSGAYVGEDNWGNYADGSNAKIQLPAAGVWTITINTEYGMINMIQVEGDEVVIQDPVEIATNETEIVVKGLERDDLSDTFDQNTGERTGREEEGGTGETWDNQFFFIANRTLSADEETVLEFDYFGSLAEAKTTTQCHGTPGAYMHWAAIGDVTFTSEPQHFSIEFKVPKEADGMQSIAFNMAEIKEACNYTIKNVKWYLKSESLNEEGKTMENLIDATGTKNFYVKEGAGTTPYEYGTDPAGISRLKANAANNAAIFNLAGQRVGKNFKGIVVKSGKKMIQK